MDTVDRKTRSRIMASVKGRDTKPELALRSAIWRLGLRFRKNDKRLPGTPDVSFASARVAVFVDGDFWHGRKWVEEGKLPGTNAAFWEAKFRRNVGRDVQANNELAAMGWLPVRMWESDVMRDPGAAARLMEHIIRHPSRS